ncbi:myeloid differentiation primary response protein MyD88-like [Mizuhopecten yessoensis]|uniref:Myeloid differentiation primary response protein MyD88 n=1 Tax=Mizuhopecten yessoensis TaxID=6573 RepID=A0A210QMJ2_MIZYE|nr:myeloid differentiation primary response protein MyD88-like [Mizuhopecten yessoensis]OWF49944.1 Myeloid differentiation primary response protein MyD88 [Mizuhopecten yessoensis]
METLPDIVSRTIALPQEGHKLPISILNMASRRKLADMLNPERELDDSLELIPDYSGLAELISFMYNEILGFQNAESPTHALLNEWEKHNDKNPCIGQLWVHLEKLQRVDVMEESIKYISIDIDNELRRREKPSHSCNKLAKDGIVIDDQLVLTKEDIKYGCPQYYDVFVCWNSESVSDARFVEKMATKLEDNHFKLCIPTRDDLPGQAQYHSYATLIKIRCRLMIIVLSEEYHKSVECDFMTKFAHALSPATKQKKLVPVIVSKMDVPNLLRHVTLCDFTKEDMVDWNWKRLLKAVKDVSPDWEEGEGTKATHGQSAAKDDKKERKTNFFSKLFARKTHKQQK